MGEELALKKNKLYSSNFPLEFNYKKFTNSYGLYISALSLKEVSKIFAVYARPILNIFEVDHYWSNPESKLSDTLQDVAAEQGVPYHAYDSENISITREYLSKLLEDFDHYNFHFYDSPTILDVIEYINIRNFINQSDNMECILDGINQSGIWVDSHDDCYFYIEARDKSLLELIATKALDSLYQVILESNYQMPIKLSRKVIDEIFVENRPMTILQLPEIIKETVRVPFFFKDYPWTSNGDLSQIERFKVPDGYMIFDMGSGECTMQVGDCV